MARAPCGLLALALIAVVLPHSGAAEDVLSVGSKRFTESYVLGEILAQTAARASEVTVRHKPGLGSTGILFAALRNGAIDVYPEYTGTIALELLNIRSSDLPSLNRELAPLGLAASVPLGFDNTYALAMLEREARRRSISAIGDLAGHPLLKLGLSPEFLNRNDGWPGLKAGYGLTLAPTALEHGLAYEALAAGEIHVMDIYSTDAKIAQYKLRVLKDEQHYFPDYSAVLLYRADLPQRFPKSWAALRELEGSIPAHRMVSMNAQAELAGRPFARIAADFLGGPGQSANASAPIGRSFLEALFADDFARLTWQHLVLVFASLACGALVGVPLGIWAERSSGAAAGILSIVGVIQTVPSLALLAFLIPLLGQIGTVPALFALFLYSLLPIVRNTHSGLLDIPAALRESAAALGLPRWARLRLIELPLASRGILAGIKTSAVINVGTATIAAFVGAGGYGERIATGLALNDNTILLAGAVPAACLALSVQWLFELLDRRLIPEGLR